MKKVLAMLLVGGFAASASAQDIDATVLGSDYVVLEVKSTEYTATTNTNGKGVVSKERETAQLVIKTAKRRTGEPFQAVWVVGTNVVDVVATFTDVGPKGKGSFSLEVEVPNTENYVALGKYKSESDDDGKNSTPISISSKGAGVSVSPTYSSIKVRLNKKLTKDVSLLGLSDEVLADVGATPVL